MNGPYLPVAIDEVRALVQLANNAYAAGVPVDPAASYALQAIVDRARAGHYYDPTPIHHEQTYEYYEETVEYWEETTMAEYRPHWSVELGRALWRIVR